MDLLRCELQRRNKELETAVREVRGRLRSWKDGEAPNWNESDTRELLVDPILRALGWNPVDEAFPGPGVCLREHFPFEDTEERVDYAMFDQHGRECILLEAKRVSEHTMNHYEQLDRYAEGASWCKAVLTNGEWWNIITIMSDVDDYCEESPIGLLVKDPREVAQLLSEHLSCP